MTVENPKPKQLLPPVTTGAGSAMNQSQFLAITCNSLQARERSRVHGAIGFGLASHWLKNWRESFKPITKRSNRNHGVTFDSHLKTALASKENVMPCRKCGIKLLRYKYMYTGGYVNKPNTKSRLTRSIAPSFCCKTCD